MAIIVKVTMTDAGTGGGNAYAESGAASSEAVLNIRTVRACRAEPEILGRFAEMVNAIAKKKGKGSLKSGIAYGFGMMSIFLFYLVVFSYGPYNVEEGWCSGEEMFKALFCM